MANDFDFVKYYNLEKKNINEEELREYFKTQNIKLVFWKDHFAEFADTRVEEVLGHNAEGLEIVQHNRFDGDVQQEGTPVSAENLGQMEWNDLKNFFDIRDLQEKMDQLQVQVSTFLGGNANNMPYNQFVISAKALSSEDADMVIVEGWYDAENGRGVV